VDAQPVEAVAAAGRWQRGDGDLGMVLEDVGELGEGLGVGGGGGAAVLVVADVVDLGDAPTAEAGVLVAAQRELAEPAGEAAGGGVHRCQPAVDRGRRTVPAAGSWPGWWSGWWSGWCRRRR